MPSRLRRLADRLLIPWYDREKAAADAIEAEERQRHTESLRRQAIAARISSEQVREAYRTAGARLDR